MISFFPDINVWVALSDDTHSHHRAAWDWLAQLPLDVQLVFCRFTHLGLMRLLMNEKAMGPKTHSVQQAWAAYDRWIADPRVEFKAEPDGLMPEFRRAIAPFNEKPATKWIADCYLLAYCTTVDATLVTFDQALLNFAARNGYTALSPE